MAKQDTIQIYHSTRAGNLPANGDGQAGELWVNTEDKTLGTFNAAGDVVHLLNHGKDPVQLFSGMNNVTSPVMQQNDEWRPVLQPKVNQLDPGTWIIYLQGFVRCTPTNPGTVMNFIVDTDINGKNYQIFAYTMKGGPEFFQPSFSAVIPIRSETPIPITANMIRVREESNDSATFIYGQGTNYAFAL